MKKVLFIASHRKDRAPGQRFRFEQYFDFLEQNGYKCDLSYIISEYDDKILYSEGNYFDKAKFTFRSYKQRLEDVKKMNDYDIIFIFREALMTKSIYFEKKFCESKAKTIFDFDDAIWLSNVSNANKKFSWMKSPAKTSRLIKLCDMIFAGNQYLADYAAQFNNNIKIVPTTIDLGEYKPVERQKEDERICIGWSGSITTI
ncbi:MAG: hypothetical protein ABEH43_07870, partial [Flavobacteriales bacterium]